MRLLVIGWLTGLALQTGAFGTIDTERRYQATRSLWRGELEVLPGSFPDFGLQGPDGVIHTWYGIGQSLLMLPADLAAGAVTKLAHVGPVLRRKAEAGLVAYATFPLLTALTAFLGYLLLRELGFGRRARIYGTLAWLFGTTCLNYAQIHFENSLDLVSALLVFLGTLRWAKSGARVPLICAGFAAALDLTARLHTVADSVIYAGAAIVAVLPNESGARAAWLKNRVYDFVLIFGLLTACGLAVDRGYQVARFGWGAVGTSYIHIWSSQFSRQHPGLPENYVFSGPLVPGLLNPLVGRNRSMFLYDPLAIALPLVAGVVWYARRMGRPVAVLLSAAAAALLLRLLFFARFIYEGGGVSWSSRYTLTPLQLMLLLTVPLFYQALDRIPRAFRFVFLTVLCGSVALQLASVLVSPSLEVMQANCTGRPAFIVPDRMLNAVRLLTGHASQSSCEGKIPGDVLRVQFMPWLNGPELPNAVHSGLLVGWFLLVAVLLFAIAKLLAETAGAEPE
ncbi:MAG TPA: hypothetical protein VGI10_14160 [Polyangiaceae bacterium]